MRGWIVACALALCGAAAAGDWPGFLGPDGTGVSAETVDAWPAAPAELWRVETGDSWAAPAIAGGRLVYAHRREGQERLECVDAATGTPRWSYGHPVPYEDAYGAGSGPRATPLVSGGRVYALGVTGQLVAVDLATGQPAWTRDLAADFHPAERDLFFGVGMSPVRAGDLILIGIGGADGAGIVALDAATGKTAWARTPDGPSYSTPLVASVAGTRLAFFLTRAGVVCLEPASGAVRWSLPFRSRTVASVNAATPVLTAPGRLFVTSSYDVGGMLLDVEGPAPRELWRSDVLSCHFATPIAVDGYLYGFDGRYDFPGSSLRCVEAATGKLVWKEESVTKGTLIRAGARFLIWAEGRLTLAELTPKGYRALSTAALLPGPSWTPPALAQGRAYLRNEHTLVCVKLAP